MVDIHIFINIYIKVFMLMAYSYGEKSNKF